MFPNVRLMIVAILAAIAGIGCGLGLFATFRVNHEPLARFAEGSSPLQLAFDNRALGSDARAPLEARLPVDGAAKPISAPMIIATPSPAPSPAPNPAPNPASSAGPNAVPSAVPQPSEADSSIAGSSSVQQEPAGATAKDYSNTASLALAVPAEQSSVTLEAPGQQETAAALQDQQPAAAVPMPPATEQTAAVDAVADDQKVAAKPTKPGESKAAKPAARAPRVALARRVAKAIRARRAVAKVTPQPAYQYSQPTYTQPTYTQPTYTWADGAAQASQPVKRVQIKRHRAAKKTMPAAQSNASAATAGLSGTQ
jgi:hypothetical protein